MLWSRSRGQNGIVLVSGFAVVQRRIMRSGLVDDPGFSYVSILLKKCRSDTLLSTKAQIDDDP